MNQRLAAVSLDAVAERLKAWRKLPPTQPPANGWVRLIRDAIGMSSPQLARRLGMTRQGVVDLEQREARGTITLDALQRAAAAMECDLVYAVVPRVGLRKMVKNQGLKVARHELADGLPLGEASPELEARIAARAEELVLGRPKDLWES